MIELYLGKCFKKELFTFPGTPHTWCQGNFIEFPTKELAASFVEAVKYAASTVVEKEFADSLFLSYERVYANEKFSFYGGYKEGRRRRVFRKNNFGGRNRPKTYYTEITVYYEAMHLVYRVDEEEPFV